MLLHEICINKISWRLLLNENHVEIKQTNKYSINETIYLQVTVLKQGKQITIIVSKTVTSWKMLMIISKLLYLN